jgi:hypothetical protein
MALNPSKWRHKKRIEPKGNVSHRFARRIFFQKGMTRSIAPSNAKQPTIIRLHNKSGMKSEE